MKLLYPTDGSETAKAAMQFALDIAKAQGWSVLVLSVAEEIKSMGVEWKEMEEPLAKFARDFAEEAAKEMRKNNVSVETKIVTGKPGEKIVEIAKEEGVDAIVMGTHGWTGLARAVIGSVADRVVRHAHCPVILVPSKEKD